MEYSIISNMARTGVNSILSTSAGRLFDAASAVLGIRRSSTFEGESSTALMFEEEKWLRDNRLSVSGYLKNRMNDASDEYLKSIHYDTNNLVTELARRLRDGDDRTKLAFTFHDVLSEIITEKCRRLSDETDIGTIALSGGVGDYVMVHAGAAIAKITNHDDDETMGILKKHAR